ncbi:MAG TPA: winged helix-turn-helix domain-containing protein [Bryobacteraceae bacterium]
MSHTFHFGAFEVNEHLGELRKHGVRIRIQEQPFQILALLLHRAGDVVDREEIRRKLWPEDTYVDFDNAISSAVRKLREALGDSAENPRFVETLARRGYRFVAPVSRPSDVNHSNLITSTAPSEISKPTPHRRHRWRGVSTAAAAVLLGAVGITWWITNSKENRTKAPTPPVPLTSYPGYERYPSFSPDGTRVAFTWDEPGKRPSNIYMKLIGAGDPVRLTSDPKGDFAPAWSPDGRWIAFLRARDGGHASVIVMAAVGGQERELTQIEFPVTSILHHWPLIGPPFLAWSPDANWLLALEKTDQALNNRIIRISVETGEKRAVTSPFQETTGMPAGDECLALSPDGKILAFTRSATFSFSDIYVVPVSQDLLPMRQPQRLTHDNKNISGLAWTADGRNLVFSSTRGGKLELWQMAPVTGSKPVRLVAGGDDPQDLVLSRRGHRLVYTREFGDVNIWRMGLSGSETGKTSTLIASTRNEVNPAYSPDGKQIAFESNRSGDENIWVANEDGTNSRQLTFIANAWAGSPQWSPDGQKIAFDCNVTGNWDIYVVGSQGGKPLPVTTNPASDYKPSWSHDGKWIYFSSSRNGTDQIWKIPAMGGKPIRISKNANPVAFESPDGKTLYVGDLTELWKMPAGGGEETRIWDSLYGGSFSPAKDGVYIIDDRDLHLKMLDPQGTVVRTIAPVPGPARPGISVSTDERRAIYAKSDYAAGELMLVENFH